MGRPDNPSAGAGQRPNVTAETAAKKLEREERLAAALRDNMKRRKSQTRAQGTAGNITGNPDQNNDD